MPYAALLGIIGLVGFGILWFLTSLIPFEIFEFWAVKGNIIDWFGAS